MTISIKSVSPAVSQRPAIATQAPLAETPAWLDQVVPRVDSVPVLTKPALVASGVGAAAGAVAGTVLGNLGQAVGLGAVGAAVGAGAGLALGLSQLRSKNKRADESRMEILTERDETLNTWKNEFGLNDGAVQEFKYGRCFQNEKGLVVEFPRSGHILSVANPGGKNRPLNFTEGEVSREDTHWIGEINSRIPDTVVRSFKPGKVKQARYVNDLGGHYYEDRENRKLQVTLNAGVLSFENLGEYRANKARYDLNTGEVRTPHVEMDGAVLKHVRFNQYVGPPKDRLISTTTHDGFTSAGGNDHVTPPLDPLALTGELKFPEPKGSGEVRIQKSLDYENRGLFTEVRRVEKHEGYKVPEDQWIREVPLKLVSDERTAKLAGGAVLRQTGETDLTVDGQPSTWSMTLSENEIQLTHDASRPRGEDPQYRTVTVESDGTITWHTSHVHRGTAKSYTYHPDGTSSGKSKYGDSGEWKNIDQSSIPRLMPDGSFAPDLGRGSWMRLPVSPARIGVAWAREETPPPTV